MLPDVGGIKKGAACALVLGVLTWKMLPDPVPNRPAKTPTSAPFGMVVGGSAAPSGRKAAGTPFLR